MKELKDYLHLYLGCEVEFLDRNGDIGTGRLVRYDLKSELPIGINHKGFRYDTNYDYEEFKPILRPLSDMTDKEKKEVEAIENNTYPIVATIPENIWTPNEIIWCLSKHFDLFGLIEAGLAIDATTLKEQTT